MGAKEFICTKDKDWHKPYAFTFDFILNTADAIHKFNLPDYFSVSRAGDLDIWLKSEKGC